MQSRGKSDIIQKIIYAARRREGCVMDYKKNLRYFQNDMRLLITGVSFTAVSVLLWMIRVDWEFQPRWIAPYTAVVGIVLLVIEFSLKASSKTLDELIEYRKRNMEDAVKMKYDLYDRQIKFVNSAVMESYDYTDRTYIRRDGNGRFRTANYAVARIYFTNETLCFVKKTFSLLEDKEELTMAEIPYAELTGAHIDEADFTQTVGKREYTVKYHAFVIEGKDGAVFSCPSPIDHSLTTCVEDIEHMIKRANGEND